MKNCTDNLEIKDIVISLHIDYKILVCHVMLKFKIEKFNRFTCCGKYLSKEILPFVDLEGRYGTMQR